MLKAFSDQFRIRAERESREDRLTGAFFGLLAGDDFGGPTSMAIALAQSLLKQESFNRNDVLNQYIQWWKDDGFDSGLSVKRYLNASHQDHRIRLHLTLLIKSCMEKQQVAIRCIEVYRLPCALLSPNFK